ncbi:V-type ATP synthase subunit E [Candidatus Chlamydia sanziniae]|uniref:V-type ATP synthase subunit E n=1 Tax=Candidatus Chlamydia sanziniae TaxID=1806891 RepID=A0A1A9HV44_9CHLA|nr:V-type ATP synthase subunit E [Candidatus Chlamydia sanziniae]ANH78870.1 V-type ATP synthase subunit E [Candidatus Chlamydia sanziniae]
MTNLSADDKLKHICDTLRLETLKPAEEEASAVVQSAKEQAKRIIQEAQDQAKSILATAKETANQKIKQGEATLSQAGKRSLEALKQAVEHKIFKESLAEWLEHITTDPEVVAKLITALVQTVENQGIMGNLMASIGKQVNPRAVNELLGKAITTKLRKKGIVAGSFVGGVQLKIEEKNWVLDLSSDTLLDLFMRYLQKDFREMIFQDS